MRVIFYETFSEEEEALKAHLPDSLQAEFRPKPIQDYADEKPPASVLSVRTQSRIPEQWLPELKGILTRSSGYDHLKELAPRVLCGYLPDYCARTVAEHAVCVILALLKKLKSQISHFNTFNRSGLTGSDCQGRHLLVVGVGKIGRQVADLGKGLGMSVKGVDLVEDVPDLDYVSLEDGIAFADIIVCTLPLTKQTRHLLSYQKLCRMKNGSLFVNVSRGEISPLEDLAKLMSEGVLSGIGMDVYENEPMVAATLQQGKDPADKTQELVLALKDRENVIFTPHNAFNSSESLKRKAEQSCQALEALGRTNQFSNPVPQHSKKTQGVLK